MVTILEYKLKFLPRQTLLMPLRCTILSARFIFADGGDYIAVYAKGDTDLGTEKREFRICSTNQDLLSPDLAKIWNFIGSVSPASFEHDVTWHVFSD